MLGLDFVAHSVPDGQPLKHEQLVRAGGKDQVPFLIDHSSGIKLYESRAILAYLDKTYGEPEPKDRFGKLVHEINTRLRASADPIAWRLSSPLLRAQEFQHEAINALKSIESTVDFVRKRIETAVAEARAKAQGAEATAGEKTDEVKGKGARAVHPDIHSATETEAA